MLKKTIRQFVVYYAKGSNRGVERNMDGGVLCFTDRKAARGWIKDRAFHDQTPVQRTAVPVEVRML